MKIIHTAVCTACEQTVASTQQSPYPDNGWVMEFDDFGYYGGFTDNIDALLDNRVSSRWFLCHDCVVKFLNLFPNLARTIHKGGHGRSGDTDTSNPCCEWEWRISDSGRPQIVGTDGEWRDLREMADGTWTETTTE